MNLDTLLNSPITEYLSQSSMAKIDGLERIRYTTSHPNDMGDDLIAVHGEVEKLMPYLHLPVQWGSDKVWKAMNRKHAAADYLKV